MKKRSKYKIELTEKNIKKINKDKRLSENEKRLIYFYNLKFTH